MLCVKQLNDFWIRHIQDTNGIVSRETELC